jgi:hypothetical protein
MEKMNEITRKIKKFEATDDNNFDKVAIEISNGEIQRALSWNYNKDLEAEQNDPNFVRLCKENLRFMLENNFEELRRLYEELMDDNIWKDFCDAILAEKVVSELRF